MFVFFVQFVWQLLQFFILSLVVLEMQLGSRYI